MVAFSSLVLGLSAIAVSLAAPTEPVLDKRGPFNFVLGPDHPFARRSNVTRRSNTDYNQDYTTGGTVNYSPGTNEFSVSWNTQDDFVVGVGWNPGSTIPITHSGSFSVTSGLGSLSVYGWTTNPLVEYYIIEDEVNINQSGEQKGTVESDGGTYTIWENERINAPSIVGTTTFNQYISIRTSPRTSGTVTVENHFKAWASVGLNLGTLDFQVIAVESWSGSGSAQQSVTNTGSSGTSSGGGSGSSGGGGSSSGSCSALYGQCAGEGWSGPKCCSTGSCKYSNPWYSQCLN